jgi:hypothetical protein
MIKEQAFIGQVPKDVIFNGIHEQFQNYIGTTDEENYVDIFYNQLAISYKAASEDIDYSSELKEILDDLYLSFLGMMKELFQQYLTISIKDLENEIISEELEYSVRRTYEYFILGARDNFKVVISRAVEKELDIDNPEYMNELYELLQENYSSLLKTITPTQFLEYRGEKEMISLFDDGIINGNFLRKYSPKLYRNTDFYALLVNHITMVARFNKSAIDSD